MAIPAADLLAEEVAAVVAVHGDGSAVLVDGGCTVALSVCLDGIDGGDGAALTALPALALRVGLPASYPLEAGEVSASAPWLPPGELQDVERALRGVWAEAAGDGEPVLLLLVQEVMDRGARLAAAAIDEDGALAEYSAEREAERFRELEVTCPVCFTESAGSEHVRFGCGHSLCRGCFDSLSRINITEGALSSMRCVEPDCGQPMDPSTLRRELAPELLQRMERLALQRDVEAQAVFCPRCETPHVRETPLLAVCVKCFYAWCPTCREAYHPSQACETEQVKLARKLRRMEDARKAQDSERRAAEHRRLEEELKSASALRANTTRCPGCGAHVSKTAGCNKMTCHCGVGFCYACGKDFTVAGYGHFRSGLCTLFDPEEIRRWEHQMAAVDQADVQAQRILNLVRQAPQEAAERMFRCPTCRQVNLRPENGLNHIKCWACRSSSCFNCGAGILRGKVRDHFRPGGCPQHSPVVRAAAGVREG